MKVPFDWYWGNNMRCQKVVMNGCIGVATTAVYHDFGYMRAICQVCFDDYQAIYRIAFSVKSAHQITLDDMQVIRILGRWLSSAQCIIRKSNTAASLLHLPLYHCVIQGHSVWSDTIANHVFFNISLITDTLGSVRSFLEWPSTRLAWWRYWVARIKWRYRHENRLVFLLT